MRWLVLQRIAVDCLIAAPQFAGAQTSKTVTSMSDHHALDVTARSINYCPAVHGHRRVVLVILERG
ncbi:MAG: hypothetical protein ABSG54_17215 [Terriglobia bacterium]